MTSTVAHHVHCRGCTTASGRTPVGDDACWNRSANADGTMQHTHDDARVRQIEAMHAMVRVPLCHGTIRCIMPPCMNTLMRIFRPNPGQLVVIFIVFSITGWARYLARPLMELVGLTNDNIPGLICNHCIIFMLIAYQIMLVTFGTIFGQRAYFWRIKKMSVALESACLTGPPTHLLMNGTRSPAPLHDEDGQPQEDLPPTGDPAHPTATLDSSSFQIGDDEAIDSTRSGCREPVPTIRKPPSIRPYTRSANGRELLNLRFRPFSPSRTTSIAGRRRLPPKTPAIATFNLMGVIGTGGMGRVYLAIQDRPDATSPSRS